MAGPVAITIRPLHETELDAVERALRFGVPEKHRGRLARQRTGSVLYLIAWQESFPVGHALLKLLLPRDDPRQVARPRCPELEDLLVHPEWRSRGIGSQLLDAVEQAARERGYSEIGLSVAVDNAEAQRLYARRGYVDAGLGVFSLGGAYLEADGTPRSWTETCTYLVKRLREE